MMKKKYFNVYLIILFCSILFFMNPLLIFAEMDSITETIYWNVKNDELVIQATELADGYSFSGRNAIKNESSSWYNYEDKRRITKVKITEPIAPVNLSDWFEGFSGCKEIDISLLDTTFVTNMSSMFSNCESLETLDISHFNTSKVTNMSFLFRNCESLVSLTLGQMDTSSVTNMESMFYRCAQIQTLDVNFNTENVVNMRHTFYGCRSLKELDLSGFQVDRVEFITSMLGSMPALKKISLSASLVSKLSKTGLQYSWYKENSELEFTESFPIVDAGTYYKKCSITFYGFDVEIVGKKECFYGETIDSSGIEIPKNSGYAFEKWVTTRNGTIGFDFTEPITGDVEIYSRFHPCLHEFNAWEITRESACDVEGSRHRFCEKCGYEQIEAISKLPHQFESFVVGVEPTCEEEGSLAHYHCSVCNKNYDSSEEEITEVRLPAKGHDFREILWDWDNTSFAAVSLTCGVCNKHIRQDATMKEEILSSSTCVESGAKKITAYIILQGRTYSDEKIEALPKTEHSYGIWIVEGLPSCEQSGEVAHYHCEICSKNFDAYYQELSSILIPALGHNYSEMWTIDKEATCEEAGIQSHHCTRCESKIEATEVAALGHSYKDWEESVAATCVEKGEEVRVCIHNADHKEVRETPALGHNYSEMWTIDKEATCEEAGIQSHHCTRCESKIEATEVAALGHSYKDWEESVAATCVEKGEEVRVCIHNADHKEVRETPALGHSYSEIWKSDSQVHYHFCIRCEERRDQGSHSFNAWKVEKNPTTKEPGIEEHICNICKYKEVREIPVLPKTTGLSVGAITGIVLGCFLIVGCVFYGVGLGLYKKKKIKGKFWDTIYKPFSKIKQSSIE